MQDLGVLGSQPLSSVQCVNRAGLGKKSELVTDGDKALGIEFKGFTKVNSAPS